MLIKTQPTLLITPYYSIWLKSDACKTCRLYNAQYSIVFAVGEIKKQFNNHESIQRSLKKENGFHGDILQCNYTDNYKALPIKVSVCIL